MNLAQVARILAAFTAFFTAAQVPLLLWALVEPAAGNVSAAAGFTASIGVGATMWIWLRLAGRGGQGELYRKEAIAVAGIAWVLAGLLGAIPFQWSGLLPAAWDAIFETISGLTTCGATVLGSGGRPTIESVPGSLLFWRALTQWFGGLGIVLVFVALLPAMGVTGKNLISSESVGVGTNSYQPRALEKARLIAGIYLGLTAACALLLVLVGGFGAFDAVCQAFTAVATGGYSTRGSIADFDSLGAEVVLTGFMFAAGASFAFVATHWRSRWRGLPPLLRSGEFRIYCLVTAGVVGACTLALVRAGLPFGTALRQAAFNGVSMLTSTGFATADFQAWPAMAIVVLFCAMFVGGCTGSTAGGIKQVRLLVTLKLIAYTVRHFVRPKSVERLKLDGEAIPAAVISSVLAIVLLWLVCVVLGAIALTFEPRFDFLSAFSTSASMLGSTGPALCMVEPASAAHTAMHGGAAAVLAGAPNLGPLGGFGDLPDWTKALLCFEMVLGRLELLTLLALFTPSFWRR
jgi:trk system potassium uptake protein TrkH